MFYPKKGAIKSTNNLSKPNVKGKNRRQRVGPVFNPSLIPHHNIGVGWVYLGREGIYTTRTLASSDK